MSRLVHRFVALLRSSARSSSPLRGGLFALVALVAPSFALGADVRLNGETLIVNEVPVFAFKSGGRERAESIAKDLRSLQGGESVSVDSDAGGFVIRAGNVMIRGLEAEAAARSVASRWLAHDWAAKLTHAISLPPLAVSSPDIRLGVGTAQSVLLVGSAVRRAQVQVDDSSIATATLAGGELSVRAVRAGRALVRIRSGIATATLAVQVKEWAAVFPQTIHVDVSGMPALASTVDGAVLGALRTRVVTAQAGNCAFTLPAISDMRPGSSKTITVGARATAPDTLPATGKVSVVVQNLGLPHVADDSLWYSNDPESVDRPGALFSESLRQGQSVRLLYHHQNASQQAFFFRVQAINDTDSTAALMVIPGDSGPDKNPVHAGLKAADAYLRAWQFDSGEVVSIPPHSTIPISVRRVFAGDTMSGLCGLRLVSGPKAMQIRTDAWPQFPVDGRWEAALYSPTPWRQVGSNPVNDYDTAPYEPSRHVYPNPYRDESVAYEVGGRFGELRLGQRPIASQDEKQRLDGNFGVLYRIRATLSNPTKDPTDVELIFEASAGYAGGLFLVNGDFKTTSLLRPKEQACIGRFHLAPGAKQILSITTLPLSGGSYPATLKLRPVPPATTLRHTPPATISRHTPQETISRHTPQETISRHTP